MDAIKKLRILGWIEIIKGSIGVIIFFGCSFSFRIGIGYLVSVNSARDERLGALTLVLIFIIFLFSSFLILSSGVGILRLKSFAKKLNIIINTIWLTGTIVVFVLYLINYKGMDIFLISIGYIIMLTLFLFPPLLLRKPEVKKLFLTGK